MATCTHHGAQEVVLELSVETGQERTTLKLKPGQQMKPSGKDDFLKQLRSREEISTVAEPLLVQPTLPRGRDWAQHTLPFL